MRSLVSQGCRQRELEGKQQQQQQRPCSDQQPQQHPCSASPWLSHPAHPMSACGALSVFTRLRSRSTGQANSWAQPTCGNSAFCVLATCRTLVFRLTANHGWHKHCCRSRRRWAESYVAVPTTSSNRIGTSATGIGPSSISQSTMICGTWQLSLSTG